MKRRESKTQYALLGILAQCEMNGYEIHKYIESTISFFWSESFGQIYPTLSKLEESGWIKEWERVDREGKKKKVYKITRTGLEEFRKWMNSSKIQVHKRNELMFKVFFGRHMQASRLLEQLELETEKTKEDLTALQTFRKELKMDWEKHPDHDFWSVTLDFAEKQNRLQEVWLEKVKEMIREKTNGEKPPLSTRKGATKVD
ncbi:transcription Regulator [Leptospira ryugenii]|uniref:Transcription Regulator n=1 Tax=Leptospira ryugenii TaxID=1917863 RepID=A0A2P2DZ29_9LEPT|nr:PadR family transcriptional regulator [Leptospira ryugenii]GBF49887.1 transcription Regulator [Leptospira ryugenii]